MFCDSGNLPSPVDTPQFQFKSRYELGNSEDGSLCELFCSHLQARGGTCPQLSCLRSEELLSIASFITSELINPGVCCIHLFFQSGLAWRICGSSVVTFRVKLTSLHFTSLHFTSLHFS
jgi:hypothetical protein